jgi:hypothetical protein
MKFPPTVIFKIVACLGLVLFSTREALSEGVEGSPAGKALTVGAIEVPRHTYEREWDKLRQQLGRAPSAAEVAKWREDWADRLRIVNLAIRDGYSDHPQVKATVARMSRHMLLFGQDGPFIREIIDPRTSLGESPDDPKTREAKRSVVRKTLTDETIASLQIDLDKGGADAALAALNRPASERQSDPGKTNDFDGLPLCHYSLEGGGRPVLTVGDFLRAFDYQIVKRRPNSPEQLLREVEGVLINNRFHALMVEKGLHRDPAFLMEQEHFRNNVIYNTYFEFAIAGSVELDEAELGEYYHKHTGDFRTASEVSLWEIVIERQETFSHIKRVVEKVRNQEKGLVGLPDELKTMGIVPIARTLGKTTEGYADQMKSRLFGAPPGWVSPPIAREGGFTVLIKSEDLAYRISPYEEVRDRIAARLRSEKGGRKLGAMLISLREQFPLAADPGLVTRRSSR